MKLKLSLKLCGSQKSSEKRLRIKANAPGKHLKYFNNWSKSVFNSDLKIKTPTSLNYHIFSLSCGSNKTPRNNRKPEKEDFLTVCVLFEKRMILLYFWNVNHRSTLQTVLRCEKTVIIAWRYISSSSSLLTFSRLGIRN